MGATLTTVDAITKEVYGPRIVDQLENETVLTKRIEKTSRGTSSEAGGKYVTFPLKTRRNAGIGYRNELEQLQSPGQQGWTNVRVPLRYGYGRVHLSGQTIDLVSENFQSFSNALTEEMEGLKTDILKDVNRILWGDGTGTLATCATATGPATTFDAGSSLEDVKWVDLNMQVDIYASDLTTVRASNRKVTAIDPATGIITTDGANYTTQVGDVMVRTGNISREPKGLTALVRDTTTTLFNLSPGTEPLWKSVVTSMGGALTEAAMVKMCDDIRMNGGKPSVIFSDLGSRRAYFNLLVQQRRYSNTKEFDGGFSGLAFAYDGELPVVTDVDAPQKAMWFLREDDFKVYRRKPWYFEDRDGGIWKWVTDYDAFQAVLKQYWEFAIERRNTQGVLHTITAG